MIQETFPLTVGGDDVANERTLLTKVESGTLMNGADSVRFIVIHCSATRCDRDYTVEQLMRDHKARGFRTIGYHFYIRRDGAVTRHRGLLEVGAHCRPYNRCSIGICYEGGLNEQGRPADTRTAEQKMQLMELLLKLRKLRKLFPQAKIVGHRELPGVRKECPCFDCGEYGGMKNREMKNEE